MLSVELMKNAGIISALMLVGITYFLVDLWLQDPFSSVAREPVNADALNYVDFSSDESVLTDVDDAVLTKDVQQLDTEFHSVLKEARTMPLVDIADETPKKDLVDPVAVTPWSVVNKSLLTDDIRLREGIEPLQIVQINSDIFQSTKKGDQLSFPINDRQLVVTVSSTKTLWNGDVSIQGTLQSDDGNTFPVVISSGKNATFASFSTSKGSFELEAFGKVGGLYSVNEMDKQAFFPKTDELLN